MKIQVEMHGTIFTQEAMDAWKYKRLKKALRTLHITNSGNNIEEMNTQLIRRKMQMSDEKLWECMRWKLRVGTWGMKFLSRFFKQKRKIAQTTIVVSHMTAEKISENLDAFMTGFDEKNRLINLSAYPEHYRLKPHGDVQLEVIETTGNAPVPTQLFITFHDESGIKTPAHVDYTHSSVGTARLKDGTMIGGVRHQFRDIAQGVEMKLLVEFPYLCPKRLVRAHEKHLAVEFCSWLHAMHEV